MKKLSLIPALLFAFAVFAAPAAACPDDKDEPQPDPSMFCPGDDKDPQDDPPENPNPS